MSENNSSTTDGHRFSQIQALEKLNPITEKIIGCAYAVSNTLGAGFLEKVYENALAHELRKAGLKVFQQQAIQVLYDGVVVGDYIADLLVEDCVVVELKAVKALDEIHQAQCLNYLKATGFHLCLLLNFGSRKVEVKRLAL
jgi:GxxExxY protein